MIKYIPQAIMYVRNTDIRTYENIMKLLTPTQLRADIYNLLDEVLKTGLPLEIRKGDKRLRRVPVDKIDKIMNLISRPDVIQGDPDDLAEISWADEVNLDLP